MRVLYIYIYILYKYNCVLWSIHQILVSGTGIRYSHSGVRRRPPVVTLKGRTVRYSGVPLYNGTPSTYKVPVRVR